MSDPLPAGDHRPKRPGRPRFPALAIVAGVLVFVGLLVAFAVRAGEPVRRTAVVVPCPGFAPRSLPLTMVMACGDGSVSAVQLHWNTWGGTTANGMGVVEASDCVPSCAQGHPQDYPARFVLSDLRVLSGVPRYLHLTVTYLGARPYNGAPPWGDETHTYELGDRAGPYPAGAAWSPHDADQERT